MKISVIMPTLDSAKYIATSLDGLAAQTFEDFEVTAVDSGSMDGTIHVLRSYGKKGLPVRVILSPGVSPALARNVGIENSLGDYIAFCDSDDMMKPEMLKILYETAITNSSDIAVCDFDMIYPDRTIEGFARLTGEQYNLPGYGIVDYYYKFCAAPKPNNYVWSRLYKRKFLTENNIRFPSVRYSEDHLFNLFALFNSPRIAHIRQSLYCYTQRDDSAMRKHIRQTNHGLLFLEGFKSAAESLTHQELRISEPILAIYAYTRVKSILFYAWQAKLPEAEILQAISAFVSDDLVKKHLSFCIDRGYISRYCSLHGFSSEWKNTVQSMLRACLDKTALPDMSEKFA
jgi:glycosyltransferase involved in cell wall biosynthesis